MFPIVLLKRLALFIGCYLVLVLISQVSGLQRSTSQQYARTAEWFLKKVMPQAYLVAKPSDKAPFGHVTISLGNKSAVMQQLQAAQAAGKGQAAIVLKDFTIKLDEFFKFSLLFYIALVAISPVSWLRRGQMLMIGVPLLLLFSWLKLWAYTLYYTSQYHLGVYELAGLRSDFVGGIYKTMKVGTGFVLATVVWAVLYFKHGDWRANLQRLFSN